MVIRPPPLEMEHELGGGLGDSPSTPGQGRDSLAHDQVEPIDKGGLDYSRLSTGAQGGRKLVE